MNHFCKTTRHRYRRWSWNSKPRGHVGKTLLGNSPGGSPVAHLCARALSPHPTPGGPGAHYRARACWRPSCQFCWLLGGSRGLARLRAEPRGQGSPLEPPCEAISHLPAPLPPTSSPARLLGPQPNPLTAPLQPRPRLLARVPGPAQRRLLHPGFGGILSPAPDRASAAGSQQGEWG